jgi:hypothetical protein
MTRLRHRLAETYAQFWTSETGVMITMALIVALVGEGQEAALRACLHGAGDDPPPTGEGKGGP